MTLDYTGVPVQNDTTQPTCKTKQQNNKKLRSALATCSKQAKCETLSSSQTGRQSQFTCHATTHRRWLAHVSAEVADASSYHTNMGCLQQHTQSCRAVNVHTTTNSPLSVTLVSNKGKQNLTTNTLVLQQEPLDSNAQGPPAPPKAAQWKLRMSIKAIPGCSIDAACRCVSESPSCA